ncbi:DNA methyltransferase [Sinimarinibacterium sp. NLF-5-8]|uniref:DNA methyltransferase n=1 Tax=Sinimarinibacterium sp. NLF-5-8 TaxID=2698684 RepID=UPI00137C364F|nr:DNA methyltransferase [Sinimarinibacterium sp. NLF-5-8]QHS09157.1 site-specific DNA-methyltransferase [Sinimarinibacterium sp. NLF-5-8]
MDTQDQLHQIRLADGLVTLYRGDCNSAAVQTHHFDALISDPPYGMNYVSTHRDGRDKTTAFGRYIKGESFAPIHGDDKPFDPTPWVTLAGSRPCVLWGANYFSDRLPANGHWMIWDKREGNRPNDQADCEMAWSNLKGPPRLFSHLWIGLCRRGEENLSTGARKLHPNQKPVALMDWLLDQCKLKEGDTVLDPFMGSASLGVACVRRGIRYIGCEISHEYFEVARNRLEQEIGKSGRGFVQPQAAWDSPQVSLF